MEEWPPGIRPARVIVDRGQFALRFVHPERGFRDLALIPQRDQRFDARWAGGSLDDSVGLGQLRRAVLARLNQPGAAAGLGAAIRETQSLEREAERHRDPLAQAIEMVARGEAVEALAQHWKEIHDPRDGAGFARTTTQALLLAMAGLPLRARAVGQAAMPLAADADERWELGRTLMSVAATGSALDCFREAMRIAPSGTLATQLLLCAADQGDAELAADAARLLWEQHPKEHEIDVALNCLFEVGAFAGYEQLLERALARRPTAARHAQAAKLRLFQLRRHEAVNSANKALSLEANPMARLVLGACHVLAGEHRLADQLLEGLTSGEARLWRARSFFERGRLGQALEILLGEGELAGQRPAWRLWLVLAETQRVQRRLPGVMRELLPVFVRRYPARFRSSHLLYGRNDFQTREVLIQLFGASKVQRAYFEGQRAAYELLVEGVKSFGGNYSGTPTVVVDGTLTRVRVATPRSRAEQLQRLLLTKPFDAVLDEFLKKSEQTGADPFLRTYRAEMLLWTGRYEEAREAFEKVWRETHTRWGYVGLGAALGQLGRHDEALRAWEDGSAFFRFLPQEATYAYRGEVLIAQGRRQAGIEQLRHAARESPSRVGTQLALALAERGLGNLAGLRRGVQAAAALAPAVIANALRSLDLERIPADPDRLAHLAEAALQSLRGNRSSSLYTFFDGDDGLRVVVRQPQAHWQEAAGQLSGCAEDLDLKPVADLLTLP